MSKLEEYTAKAAASFTALEKATTERDRAFHRRAHMIWRRLIVGIGEAEEKAAQKVDAPKPARAPAAPRAAAARTSVFGNRN